MKENLSIKTKKIYKENEIELLRRTKFNYTHKVLEDHNIEEITTWKTSEKKVCHYYLYIILSCGIILIISKFKPLLFIKLYCMPSIPKEADYFLVKDIYGEYQLCAKENKRYNRIHSNKILIDDLSNDNILGITTNSSNNLSNQIIGFNYNSKFYEYNELRNIIIPIYFDLSYLSNKRIYQLFIEGLSSKSLVNKFKERFGLNICPLNINLLFIYFLKSELYLLIISIIIALLEALFGNIFYFIFILIFITIISLYQYMLLKKIILSKESTLEGEKKQIKVKRKYMNEENNDYCYINNIDLLPGDIIYLEKNEISPCDGIILEGQCTISLSEVKGCISEIRKKELDNSTNQFNYRTNKNSILYHGTKILNSFSKLENNSILLLCINTGFNTYKANQLINITYLFKRNKQYSEIYSIFCGKKNKLFLHCLILFISAIITLIILFFVLDSNNKFIDLFNMNILNYIIAFFIRCFIPTFHIVNSGIIFLGMVFLLKENVKCFDKSRLLYAGSVNTIFFDKTGTLSEKNFEISGFFPICMSPNSTEVFLKYYSINQIKDLTSILINYYRNYQNEEKDIKDTISNSYIYCKEKISEMPKKMAVLFLECMVTCNNLEKINNQIYGNSIEKEMFSQIKWEINISADENNEYNKNLFIEDNEENMDKNQILETNRTNNISNEIYSQNKIKTLEQKIDIYPNNYYKITEGKKIINNNNNNYYENNIYYSKDLILTSTNSKNIDTYDYSERENKRNFKINNNIVEDIMRNDNINSYKLRVYKRFIKVGTLYSSAIVYNPILKSLFFMVKGPPEKIIPCCNYNFLPKDINKTISLYRKNGYINLILASKVINEYNFDISLGEDYYMSNLLFCGIILVKSRLKKDVKKVIQQLKNIDCDLILNTGDNIYNSLTVSYDSGIITNKNAFVFDLNKKTKKITVCDFNDIFLGNEPIKTSVNSIDKVSSKRIIKKEPNIRMFSSKKMNRIANKLDIMNSLLDKESSKKMEELYSKKKNSPKPYNRDKNRKITDIPSLRLDELNSKKNNNRNKNEKNTDLYLPPPSINSKNELLEKSIDNPIENISFFTNTNTINEPQNITSSKKEGNNQSKSRISAVFSNLNKSNFNQNVSRVNSKKFLTNFPKIKIIGTKTIAQAINTNNNQIKKNIDYNSSKLKYMRDDCVYCISGKALRFIYENRNKPEFKKYEFPILLNHIKRFGKIFYEMKSKDKSFLIDYYRKIPNKITCMIGDGQNDIDAIMTSHVGINITPPININTILCHFNPIDGSLFCIEKIIRYGRVVYENIYLLGVCSLLYAVIIIIYLLTLSIYELDIQDSKLDLMNCSFFIFSVISFSAKLDNSIKSSPLFHNILLYKRFFMIISISNMIINIGFEFIFIKVFINNIELDPLLEKKILGTYCYFFCYFQLLGMIYSINSIHFYRISFASNFIFFIIMFFLLLILAFIYCICEYSLNPILYNILYFEYNSKNVDTFDDKNKLLSFIIYISNAITYYLCVFIFFKIFDKKAKSEVEKKKKLK